MMQSISFFYQGLSMAQLHVMWELRFHWVASFRCILPCEKISTVEEIATKHRSSVNYMVLLSLHCTKLKFYMKDFINNVQNQPPAVFYKKRFLKNFTKIHRKHLYQSLFFNKVEGTWGLQLYSKRNSGTGVFLWILRNFKEHLHRTPPDDYF